MGVVSCLLLTQSFRGWGTNLRVAWSMMSVLLGLAMSGYGAGSWWLRFSAVCAVGVARVYLLVVDPYLEWDAHGRSTTKSNYDPMFRVPLVREDGTPLL